jgi:putative ABC transport system substrate-binding protein
MDRRRFLLTSLAGALAAPLAAGAQQAAKVYRLGYLAGGTGQTDWERAFVQGMRELGYVEGRNLLIEYRWAAGRIDMLPKLAAELVDLRVDVIIASPTTGALAAKQATRNIPIVFPISVDAVEAGVVEGLARPGGNVTGLTLMSPDLIGKRLDFLKAAMPGASRLAFLSVRGIPKITEPLIKEIETKSRNLGMALHVYEVSNLRDVDAVDRALETIASKGADALYVLESPSIAARASHVMNVALKHRLAVLGGLREYVDGGALLFFGPDAIVMHRRAAVFVDKILKGAKPADLPVEQPTKFDLVINLKTAKSLGLTIPPSLLARADQVIE